MDRGDHRGSRRGEREEPGRTAGVDLPSLRGAQRQSNPSSLRGRMYCVAEPVIGRRFAPTRWLAMTMWRAPSASPLPLQPKRPFHHLHAAAADMGGDDRAVLLAYPRQQQTRPSHVDALADPQFQLAIPDTVEI